MHRSLPVVLVALAVTAGTAAGATTSRRPIRVVLTAQNHRPRASASPYVHWWYCVKVTTAAGTSVASRIQLRFLSGDTPVEDAGSVSLRKGYDHWCQAIGGEASLINGLPRGKKLVFQAVVTAQGMTVRRNWPIVVR